jgi:carbon storage regulator
MLVLTRRRGDRILIGNNVEIMITRVVDGQVRLAIKAPPEVTVLRAEVLERSRGSAAQK